MASGRLRALIALSILFSAVVVLFLDLVNSTRSIPIDEQYGRPEPGIQVHLTLMGSNQLLDATPALVFSPVNRQDINVQAEGLALNVSEYCVEDVLVASRAFEVGLGWSIHTGAIPEDLATSFKRVVKQYSIGECARSEKSNGDSPYPTYRTIRQNQDNFPIEWRSNNGASLFPFDAWRSVTAVYALTSADSATAHYVAPGVTLSSVVNNWDVSAQLLIVNDNDPMIQDATNLLITIRRPLSVRLFTLFLLLAVLALEAAIYFIIDQNTAIGAIVGVIFGLWSIHELLVPPGMPAVNLVRSIILFLYVVLVVVAFLRFFVKPLLQAPITAEPVAAEAVEPPEDSPLDHRTN